MMTGPGRNTQAGAATGGPRTLRRLLHYPGVSVQVALQAAPDVEIALGQVLNGWSPHGNALAAVKDRQSSVQGGPTGYRAASCYLEAPLEGLGVAGAACAVVADLAQDYFETRPGLVALHCAAFRYGDRLIALTGPSRAGKSTLAARLTMETDMQVFCDDVLPLLDDNQAIGLGIAPRLRLPLPDGCSPAFVAHVRRHMGPRDDSYGYLCAPTVAPHGTRTPLSVLLILDRRANAPARLHEVGDDDALHYLLAQNMSDLHSAERAFDRLCGLLSGLSCLRLVYSDLEDAVALIRRAFHGAARPSPETRIGPALPDAPPLTPGNPALSASISWSRKPDVVIQPKGSSAFLWQPGKQQIWHLNTLGLAVWTLLEIPGSAQDIAMILAEQFPDEDKDRLICDVGALLDALADGHLIEPSETRPAPMTPVADAPLAT